MGAAAESDPDGLRRMSAEVGTKLNLQRPNRAVLAIDAPRLERSHGRLDFAAVFGIHPHHGGVGEKTRRQRQAEVDEFIAEVRPYVLRE